MPERRSPPPSLSRRTFLRWTTAGLTVSGLGGLLLEACAPSAPRPAAPTAVTGAPTASATLAAAGGATTPVAAGGVKPPAYVPMQKGTQPDLPPDANGLDAAYFKFPSNLARTVPKPPGDGSDVSAIVVLTYAPPPAVEQNAAWQAVNKYLNVNLKLQMVPTADYASAVNVVLAGSDLPDFIYDPTTTQPLGVIAALPQFARTRCADLTPFLSGDAVKEFPNLASFSSYTWRSGVV